MPTTARIEELTERNTQLSAQVETLTRQLDWFKRQLFGSTSEKQQFIDTNQQGNLLAALGAPVPTPPDTPMQTVTYQRRKKQRDGAVNDSGLRFDDTVPMEVITLSDPDIDAIPEDQREVIGEKVTHRLAQRPGSYVILKYVRPVVKRRDTGVIVNTPAPANVLDNSVVDVSFLVGLLLDKFLYHLPLYRQHQRLAQSGIRVARSSLTQWCGRAIELLRPIVDAQWQHLLLSRVLAMDETAIKAGRQSPGKLRAAYFWPLYGDSHEIVFHYAPSRAHRHVQRFLGDDFTGTLLSDGYDAYARYAEQHDAVTHAECWSHCRRYFERAQDAEPAAATEALALIAALYQQEKTIRTKELTGDNKLRYRTRHSEPLVQTFWRWCDEQCHRTDLLPSNPLSKALKYAMARRVSLQVFLTDPAVPIDTNHLERGIRPIAMGRRSWLFCWTELGAEHVALIQSLLVTCTLQGVDPYTYLVDVLQRIDRHPASDVQALTPRVWKERFAANPLRSDLHIPSQHNGQRHES